MNASSGPLITAAVRGNALLVLFLWCATAQAGLPGLQKAIPVDYPLSSPRYPVVLPGARLKGLQDSTIGEIQLFAVKDGEWRSLPFQIDRRDEQNRIQIPANPLEAGRERHSRLDANDELVFMAGDIGDRLENLPDGLTGREITPIHLRDTTGRRSGWVYAVRLPEGTQAISGRDYVRYDRTGDIVEAETYVMGFSEKQPFIANRLQWRVTDSGGPGPDIIEAMRITHRGKFLHLFNFERGEKHYRSKLVAVKDGPVRVIRRTANRVSIMLGIKSPTVFVDYLHYPAGFVMDTLVRFPFRIDSFFSDVTTTTMLALRQDPALRPLKVYSKSRRKGVAVDGRMTAADRDFNDSHDRILVLAGPFGQLLTNVVMDTMSPIETRAYLDDRPVADITNDPGTVGFYMSNWEKLDTDTHQILFQAYILNGRTPDEALRLAENAPVFMH